MKIRPNYALKEANTFGIEAIAKEYVELDDFENAKRYFSQIHQKDQKHLILGGGSNVLFTADFDGRVIANRLKGIELIDEDEKHYWVRAMSGENWHRFVMHCIAKNWAGIENLSLIPGNVGASPMQNIGAYGVEVKDVIDTVEAIDMESGALKIFNAEECAFAYRSSIFKTTFKGRYFITAVVFRLNKAAKFHTSYGAIQEELKRMNVTELSIQAISRAVINIRQSKLPDPAEIGNAGSFFKNPVVEVSLYQRIKAEYVDLPAYPQADGRVKLAAGWLIEQCGWKGKTRDNYGVHKRQALVLVNYGGANGKDIYQLSEDILKSVEERFGVVLEREVNIID